MKQQLSRLIAGLALAALTVGCARMPAPQRQAPQAPGTALQGALTPGPRPGGGGGAPAAPDTRPDRLRAGEVRTRTSGHLDLAQQISTYVAGLDAIGGGTNTGTAGRPVGAGRSLSTDMAADGTSQVGRGVGVSTILVGHLAFIGIDPATIGAGGVATGVTGAHAPLGASVSGDVRGAAGAGLEGYLRDRVRSRFPALADVFVTTDPALVSRIARAASGAGPAASQVRELIAIMRTMAPVTAGTP